jgi:hypothetical protein
MTVRIRQVWGQIEASIVNDWGRDVDFWRNMYLNGIGVGTGPVGFLHSGESKRFVVATTDQLRGYGAKQGDRIRIQIFEAGHAPDGQYEMSNEIVYQVIAVPTEAIGAGIGAVVGGVVGYFINPKEPLIPVLLGVGLGAGGGYGAGYFVTPLIGSSPTQGQAPTQARARYVVRG